MKTQFYLSTAVHKLDELIKLEGYKPKSKFGGECTALVVEQQLRECEAPGAIKNDRINEILKKIEKELNSNNSDSEFFRNCRDVVANYVITPPSSWKLKPKIWNYQLGFLAALVKDIIKEEKAPPKENLSHLGWIGTEGKRGHFFVKLIEMIHKDDYTIHKVVDEKGNRGLFYHYAGRDHKGDDYADDDSVNYTDGIEERDCFLMKATPSRHQISKYDNGKETYFNRVIIVRNKGNKTKNRVRGNSNVQYGGRVVGSLEHTAKYIDESSKIG